MTHGGLFEGIGGFSLAAQWAGIESVWSNEIDPFCCQVLRKNFKHEIIEADIRNIGKHNLKPVDIITGGFPCQPFSVAGKRKGKEDDRFLWPEMLRVIREVKPKWVVGENVTGIIGMALDQVLSEMEGEGYNTETYIIPACAVNAPHRRDRIWIIAKNSSQNGWGSNERQEKPKERGFGNIGTGDNERIYKSEAVSNASSNGLNAKPTEENNIIGKDNKQSGKERVSTVEGFGYEQTITYTHNRIGLSVSGKNGSQKSGIGNSNGKRITSNANSQGLQGSKINGSIGTIGKESNQFTTRLFFTNWQDFPTQSPVRNGDDGLSSGLVRSAIKGGGNAIVPQIAFEFFKIIKELYGND